MTMSKRLYVGKLSYNTTSDDLRDAFSKHATVVSAEVVMDRETGRSKGFAFVELADNAEAAIAALDGTDLQGRTIVVNEARPREERPRGGGGYGGGRGGDRRGGGGGYGRY
jgi:RNA recognition motif-containing protein